MSVTVTIVNDRPIINVDTATISIQRAVNAANDAEAAAIQTGLDAQETGADRIQTGLDAQATASDRIQTGLDVQATNADVIATNADRIQTGLDAQQTESDRTQTGLDRTATEADRVQTGLDVTATDLARNEAEASATTATQQATLATTARNESQGFAGQSAQSASDAEGFKNQAEGFATDAETAKDEIVDKIDFTGLAKGDLLRYDGTKLVRINEKEFLRPNEVYEKSPNYEPNLFAWDNFKRVGNTLGVADSGQTWQNLIGDSYSVNNGAFTKSAGNLSAINTGFGSVLIKCKLKINFGSPNSQRLVIGKDVNNYVVLNTSYGNFNLSKLTNGVPTVAASGPPLSNDNSRRPLSDTISTVEFSLRFGGGFSNNRIIYTASIVELNNLIFFSELLSESLFTQNSEVAFCGFFPASNLSREIYQFKIYELT